MAQRELPFNCPPQRKPNPTFGGKTFNEDIDGDRLRRQFNDVWSVMADGQWHTSTEIANASGHGWCAGSARVRDFRKPKFGGHTVDAERVPGVKGLWRYRLTIKREETS